MSDDRPTEIMPSAGTDRPSKPPTADPFDDDLNARLASLAPKRLVTRVTRVTLALAAAALLTAGFVAGAQVEQRFGSDVASDTARTPGMGGFPAGAFPSGVARQGGGRAGGRGTDGSSAQTGSTAGSGAGSTTTGTVKLVDGTTVYVQTVDGQVVTVKTTDTTTVRTEQSAELNALTPGMTVTVQGEGADGTVTATAVTGSR